MQFAPFIINEFFMRSLFNLLDRTSNYNFIKEFKQKQFHLSVFENWITDLIFGYPSPLLKPGTHSWQERL